MINEADSDNSSDEEKWEEIVENEEVTICLFCSSQFSSIEKAIPHMEQVHQFDLRSLKAKYSMDFYSYIKVRILDILAHWMYL